MPRDLTDDDSVDSDGRGLYEALVRCLPEQGLKEFTQAQLVALRDAARRYRWGPHPVDLRWSLPLLFKRFYLVILAGPERRGENRRMEERRRISRMTFANLAVLALLGLAGTVVGGFVFSLLFTWFLTV